MVVSLVIQNHSEHLISVSHSFVLVPLSAPVKKRVGAAWGLDCFDACQEEPVPQRPENKDKLQAQKALANRQEEERQ